jgi:uncharacterized protein (DUF983 family)
VVKERSQKKHVMKKQSKLYSIVTGNCPRCHEGRIFAYRNAYNLKHLTNMNDNCSKCGLKYRREPGFFMGAGYVSYTLGVAVMIIVAVAMSPWIPFFENFELYAAAMIGAVVILTPLMYRVSRIVWLNIFVKYEGDAIKKWKEKNTPVQPIP